MHTDIPHPKGDFLELQVGWLIDGSGRPARPDCSVLVRGAQIAFVGGRHEAERFVRGQAASVQRVVAHETWLLPGLVDVHTHVMFGEPLDSYEEVMAADTDQMLLLRATANVATHLRAGVTTMRDNGARNRVAFDLREGIRRGYVLSPRLLVSGRPITMSGGHFHFCGQEADGIEGVRAAVRQLAAEGADHIKIMASGGGTLGTDPTRPSYGVPELRAIVDEAHGMGLRTTAHCGATRSIANVLDAGVDMIEHAAFLNPEGDVLLEEQLAARLGRLGTPVSPTLGVEVRARERLRSSLEGSSRPAQGIGPGRRGATVADLDRLIERRVEVVRRLYHHHGVTVVTGTDAVSSFGDYFLDMEALGSAGIPPMEVIQASTSRAAKALGLDAVRGQVRVGMDADLILVEGDPLADIRAMRRVVAVMLAGEFIPGERLRYAAG